MKKLLVFYTLSLIALVQFAVASDVKAAKAKEPIERLESRSQKVSFYYNIDITDLFDPSYPKLA